jgi:hypothetical protein
VPLAQFAPMDTIYASVATEGAAPGDDRRALDLRGRPAREQSSQVIAPTGPAATEFHIAKPSGLPSGSTRSR